jgi:hypothetical protein
MFPFLASIATSTGRSAGCKRCWPTGSPSRSGQARVRGTGRQLEKVVHLLGTGDTLVMAAWTRATSWMVGGIEVIERTTTPP